ncbi:MAG: hypothetical protein Kow00120_01950 [Anaerolineae bacterium]
MPAYDFRCRDCGRQFTLTYKTFADYDAATPTCPACKSAHVIRVIRRVRMMRSEDSRLDSLESMADLDALDDLDDADPRALGRMMRKMGEEVGEDLGPEFDEVVGRLEAGEDPEAIEESMGDALDGMAADAPAGLDDSDFADL